MATAYMDHTGSRDFSNGFKKYLSAYLYPNTEVLSGERKEHCA
uniref:Uncharacterized protein n=1 Tax=Anguilla anguilla TaxID=7936 RepID=A0A0E9XVM4_ANGAN